MSSLLAQRSFESEIIDGESFSADEYAVCLRQLESINRLTLGYRPTLRAVAEVAKLTDERPLRILDIGFGNGDTLRAISNWSQLNNVAIELHGVELNEMATRLAKAQTPSNMRISFQTADVFKTSAEEKYHLVINALMMHHLTNEEIKNLLKWMSQHAKVAWFINDLHRHWVPYWFIKIFSRLAGFNRLIRHDAPLSVHRGFKKSEWFEHLRAAGQDKTRATVKWWWAFRFGVFYRTSLAGTKGSS